MQFNIRIFIIFINVVICFSFGVCVYGFYKLGKPHIRGFYCDDDSINKPYRESTVPVSLLLPIIFVIVFTVVVLVELYKKFHTLCIGWHSFKSRGVFKLFVSISVVCLLFLYGGGIVMFITDVVKYSIGRLRPNYYALCIPDWSKINCTVTSHGLKQMIFGDEHCTNKKIKEGRLSFPSGHASFTIYSATFLVIYIEQQLKLKNPWVSISKLFFQVLIATGGVFTCASRVADNKHHPTDVIAGFILGLIVGYIFMCKIYATHFSTVKSHNETLSEDIDIVEQHYTTHVNAERSDIREV